MSFTALAGASGLPAKSLFAQASNAPKEKEESESENCNGADSSYEVLTGEEGEETLLAVNFRVH